MISLPAKDFRKFAVICGTSLLVSLCGQARANEPEAGKISISRETTRVTEPVDEAGFVDYVGAVNARGAAGVTPENNAAILIWKAIGLSDIPDEHRQRFWEAIGTKPFPEGEPPFRSFPEGVDNPPSRSYEEFARRLDQAGVAPWSEVDFPEIAAWLQMNAEPLRWIEEASHKSRYFSPRWGTRGTDGREPLTTLILQDIQHIHHFAKALGARSMLRVQRGEIEEAWNDLQVCHRLGNFAAREGFLIAQLVGIAIDGIACRGEQAIARHGRLNSELAMRYERQLAELPELPEIADAFEGFERWSLLDLINIAARNGIATAINIARDADSEPEDSVWGKIAFVDWDVTLRYANGVYDRVAAALRIRDRAARQLAMDALLNDLREMKGTFQPAELVGGALQKEVVSERVAQVFVVLMFPAVDQALLAREWAEARRDITRVAFRLAGFHQQQGHFPADLSELASTDLPLPLDYYSGKELIYRRVDFGYLLYSIGKNGVDDGGATFDTKPEGDDVRIYHSGLQFETNSGWTPPNSNLPPGIISPSTFSTGTIVLMCLAATLTLGLIAWLINNRLKRQSFQSQKGEHP